MIGNSNSAPGIEFLIVGAAKVGKTTIAKQMARRFNGAYFNLSVFNRILAWWTLRSRQSNISFDLYDQERFPENLREISAQLVIQGDGSVFYDSQDVTREIESEPVSIQASQQSIFVYLNYRRLLKPIEWGIINKLKNKGPVFIVSRSRKSAHTARRAIYLEASVDVRAERLQMSNQGLSLSDAYRIILKRDLLEKTFQEKENCDRVIDTSRLSIDETLHAVALEYKKAELIANMDYYGLRSLVALSWHKGEELLSQWVQDEKKILLCCADLDNQGKFTNSFGKHVDLVSCFLTTLSEIAFELGGTSIIRGTDDLLVLFPYSNNPSQEIKHLERLRKGYLLKNFGKFGIGVVESRNGQRCGASSEEIQRLGEFTGCYAGEELFVFEVRTGQSLRDAFDEQLSYINDRLRSANILLSGHPKCLVPASTVTVGGVLVDSSQTMVKVSDLVDASYGAMQDAKKLGKNSSYLFSIQDLNTTYRFKDQPLIAKPHVISEITRQPGDDFPIPEHERRDHYPFVHRTTALERLVTRWLTKKERPDRFLIYLYPGFSGDVVENLFDAIIAQGEITVAEKAQWIYPHGYRFKALSKIYSQQNRDVLIRASVHYSKIAIPNWLKRVNKGRKIEERIIMASFNGRLLEGLRLPLESFWFFEGQCSDNEAIDLLQIVQRSLTRKLPGFDIKIFGILVPLGNIHSGSEIFTKVDIGSNVVIDSGEQITDPYGNILLKWRATEENAQSREQNERKLQALSLEDLNQSQNLSDGKSSEPRD